MKELNEASAVDFLIVYQFIKRLATPFEKTDAFELGLIDADGKRLKKAESKDEKNAMTPFDRLIFNLKRILTKFGLGGRLSTTAAALLLLREYTEEQIENEEFLIAELKESINMLNKKSFKTLKQLQEELANVTGPAVAGTGDDPVHWSRKQPKIGLKGPNRKLFIFDANKWLREKNKAQISRVEKMIMASKGWIKE
jgi:hypothetical protein